jgi:hypothetical protein
MAVYHKQSAREVLEWDDIQFAYFLRQAQAMGRWLWNFFPPEVGGKDESARRAAVQELQDKTPSLLVPSSEQFEDIRSECESHGIIGPVG